MSFDGNILSSNGIEILFPLASNSNSPLSSFLCPDINLVADG